MEAVPGFNSIFWKFAGIREPLVVDELYLSDGMVESLIVSYPIFSWAKIGLLLRGGNLS